MERGGPILDTDYKFVSFSTLAAFFFSPYFLSEFPLVKWGFNNLLLVVMGYNRSEKRAR